MTALVVQANARTLPLPDASVDLIVTSPPYFALRSYTDGGKHYAGQVGDEPTPQEFLDSLIAVTAECMRVLKPSGSMFVNLGDAYSKGQRFDSGFTAQQKSLMLLPERYRIACIDQLGLVVRAVIVWDRPNGLPESVKDRVRRSHEDWVHLTKQPWYYTAVDEIREPHTWSPSPGYKGHQAVRSDGKQPAHFGTDAGAPGTQNPLGKLPGSVWTIPTAPLRLPAHLGVDHFAAFPPEWPKRIIKGWSAPGMTILDPFGGTGTTALVADCLGRIGISVDLSHDYGRVARWRTQDEGQRAKVLKVKPQSKPKPKDEPELPWDTA